MITQERLKELFDYDPETGNLIWRVNRGGLAKIGAIAGAIRPEDGRRSVQLSGKNYKAHRLVWLYHHGKWPEFQIDHINRDPLDNRIENLRDVPGAVNMANQEPRGAYKLKGVTRHRNRYSAKLWCGTKFTCLGTFDTPEEAHEVYKRAHVDRYGANSEYFREAA